VRPLGVEVGHVTAEHLLEMATAENQEMIALQAAIG
jgi:predicted Zn-dependent protease